MISWKTRQSVIQILIAVVTLLVLSLHVGKFAEIYRAILHVRISLIVIVFFLMLVNIYIQYRKWLYILHLYYPEISRTVTFGSVLGGFTLGLITPGRLGELGRGLFLKKSDKWLVTGLTFTDKMFNNITLFFAGSLAIFYLMKFYFHTSPPVNFAYFAVLLMLWIFLYHILKRPVKLHLFILKWQRRISFLQRFSRFFYALEKFDNKAVNTVFLYSLILNGVIFGQFYLLITAFSHYPAIPVFAAIMAAMFSKNLLPVSVGDLGIREGAAVFFLSQVSVVKVHAFDASLLLFAINVLLPSIIGMFLIPRLSIFDKNGNRT